MTVAHDIVLQDGDLVAGIALRGAELRRLSASGNDLLWSGDPTWWSYVAPILFPIIGKPTGGFLVYGGQKLALQPHGFARTSTFEVQELTTRYVRLTLSASALTWPLYPFNFVLQVEFRISEAQLLQTVVIRNEGAEPMPASFGFHPALRWPAGPGQSERQRHRLEFSMAQTGSWYRCRPAGQLETVDAPALLPVQTLALQDELFAEGALVIDPVTGSAVTVFDSRGALLELVWSDCSCLGLWSLPGAPFFCIEPWQGHPPPQGAHNALLDKPGSFCLASGESRTFALAFRPAARAQPRANPADQAWPETASQSTR